MPTSPISCTRNTVESALAEARAKYELLREALDSGEAPATEELMAKVAVYEAAMNAVDPLALADERLFEIAEQRMIPEPPGTLAFELVNVRADAWNDLQCDDRMAEQDAASQYGRRLA
jgi:hypothetical protein